MWTYTSAHDGLADNARDQEDDPEQGQPPYNLRVAADARGYNFAQLAEGYYYRYITPDSYNGIYQESADAPSHNTAKYDNGITYADDKIFNEDGQYLGADFEHLHITGNNDAEHAATVFFAEIVTVPGVSANHETVSHIDIAIVGEGFLDVPLAYGTYYDENGMPILTVDGDNNVTLHLQKDVDINKEDIMRASVKAYDKDGTELNDAFYITGYSANQQTGHSAVQVRMEGSFKVDTLEPYQSAGFWDRANDNAERRAERLQNQVYYRVATNKDVTFDMVYNGTQLYDMNGQKLTVTASVRMSAGFSYWDPGNECPPLQEDFETTYGMNPDHPGQNNESWLSGAIIDNDWTTGGGNGPMYPGDSGMDFVLGNKGDADGKTVAVEIVKIIEDENGNRLHSATRIINDFDIYYNEDASHQSFQDVHDLAVSPNSISQADLESGHYSGYSMLRQEEIPVGRDGIGVLYDYSVSEGMFYVKEHSDPMAEGGANVEITDVDGRIWDYVATRTETEYVWRDNQHDGKRHLADGYSAVPEVLGNYEADSGWHDENGNPPRNQFLEFYVHNIYTPKTYPVYIRKLDALKTDTETGVAGAEFDLYGPYTQAETQETGFDPVQEDRKVNAASIVTGTGIVKIGDLSDGVYYLVETKAPDNYQPLTDPVVITVDSRLESSDPASVVSYSQPYNPLAADGSGHAYITEDGSEPYHQLAVTNEPVGTLEITKSLRGKDEDAAPTGTYEYSVRITTVIGGVTNYVRYSEEDGKYEMTPDEATLTVTNGVTLSVTDLPVIYHGVPLTYEVEEIDPDSVTITNYTNVIVPGVTVDNVEDIALDEETAAQAGLVNVYERDKGSLSIEKTVTVDGQPLDDTTLVDGTYTFAVTSDDGVDPKTEKEVTITISGGQVTAVGGDGTLEGGKAVLTGLPTGAYTVEEQLSTAQQQNGVTFTATGNESVLVTRNNSSAVPTAAFVNNIDTTSLTVSKTVVSPIPADEEKTFTFTVTVLKGDKTPLNGTFGEYAFNGKGETTVTITGSDSVTISGLPKGSSYTVTEAVDNEFVMTCQNDQGDLDEAATAAFTNSRRTGSLIVKKTLKGNGTDAPEGTYEYPIHVTVTIDGAVYYVSYNEDEDKYELTEAPSTLTVKNGSEVLTLTGLPITYNSIPLLYKVVEIDPQNVEIPQYGHVTVTGVTVETVDNLPVKTDDPVTAELVNVYEKSEPHKEETDPYEGTGVLGAVKVGDEITYEISYRNYKQDAADVTIKDGLDENVEFVTASDGGVYDATAHKVTWTLNAVPAGEEGTVTLVVKVLEGALVSSGGEGKVVNGGDTATVQVGNDNEFTLEVVENPVPEEPHKEETDPYEGTGVLGAVKVGDEITYEISYRNYKQDAADVTIKDGLDENVEFVTASDGGVYDATAHKVTWTLSAVPAGEEGTVTLVVKVLEGALVSEDGPGKVENGGPSATVQVGNDSEYELNTVENPVPETVAQITKLWDDADNQDGGRPDTVLMALYANNVATGITVTLAEDGSLFDYSVPDGDTYGPVVVEMADGNPLSAIVRRLPKYVNGELQTYTWMEDLESLSGIGYTISAVSVTPIEADGIAGTGATITNTYDTQRFCLAVVKVWNDQNDTDGYRPGSITVALYRKTADGYVAVKDETGAEISFILSDDNAWAALAMGLPKTADGSPIEYYWKETSEETGFSQYTSNANADGYIPANADTTRIGEIENTHAPETVAVYARKVWKDHENDAGKRESITLRLIGAWTDAEGNTVSAFVEDSDKTGILQDETVSWTGLPRFRDGCEISYSVIELKEIDGQIDFSGAVYTVDYAEGDIAVGEETVTGSIVTNSYEPVTEISITKTWDDGDNQDGVRWSAEDYAGIVSLYADGEQVEGAAADVVDNGDGTYTVTFADLPRFADADAAEPISYTVKEDADALSAAGYEAAYDENGNITNTHIPLVTTVKAVKVWAGDEENAVLRRDVTLTLKGVYTVDGGVKTVTIPDAQKTIAKDASGDGLTAVWTGLPVMQEGQTVMYEVEEAAVSGYASAVSGPTLNDNGTPDDPADDWYEFTVTNTLITGQLSVDKRVFVDGADRTEDYADRPFYVKVYGVVDGETYYVTADNGLLSKEEDDAAILTVYPGEALEITDLPAGVYTVTEVDADGHALSASNAPGDMGAMTWLFDLSRTADTAAVEEYEAPVPGIGETLEGGKGEIAEASLINAYTTGRYCVAVTKQWLVDGKAFADDSLTLTVTLQRSLDGEAWADVEDQTGILLNKDNNWSYVAIGMDQMNEDGARFLYQWVEDVPEGWAEGTQTQVQTVTTDDKATLVVLTKLTNSKATAQPEVTKTVTGDTDADSYDADETFTFTLAAKDGAPMPESGDTVSVRAGETGVFGVIAYAAAGEYHYTITETAGDTPGMSYDAEEKSVTVTVSADPDTGVLTSEISYGGGDSLTVENTYDVVTARPEVTKAVAGDTDADTYDATEAFTFTLAAAADGAPMPDSGDTVSVRAGETGVFGSITFTEEGVYRYTITESAGSTVGMTYDTEPKNVTVTVAKDEATGELRAEIAYEGEASLTVTNTYEPASLTVIKAVEGLDDDGLIFLVSVKDGENVYYSLNGAAAGKSEHWVEITAGEAGLTWQNLPEGVYTVTEKVEFANVHGYILSAATYQVDTGAAGTAPAQAEVNRGDAVTVTVTNIYEKETTEATVVKAWDDDDDAEGRRPVSLTLTLLANGAAARNTEGEDVSEVVLPVGGDWTATVDNLPKFDDSGSEIVYTWSEDQEQLPEGYSLTGTSASGTVTTLTNTYAPGMTSVQILKAWEDFGNQDGKRPDSVFVVLSAQAAGAAVTLERDDLVYCLTADENWTYIWTDLPETTEDGEPIVYSVAEAENAAGDPVTGGRITFNGAEYTVEVTGSAENGFTVTNRYTPDTVDVPAVKLWDDENDQDGVRPDSITVILYADGKPVAQQVLTAADADAEDGSVWHCLFTGLPEYEGGKKIEYTVKEFLDVRLNLYYEQAGDPALNDAGVCEITNKHTPETVSVQAVKVWEDTDSAYREDVTFTLTGTYTVGDEEKTVDISAYPDADGGEQTAEKTIPADAAGDGLTVRWVNLPKKLEGASVAYAVTESDMDAYAGEAGEITYDANDNTWKITITNTLRTGGLRIAKQVTENGGAALSDTAKALLAGGYAFTVYTDEACENAYTENGSPVTVTLTVGADGESVLSDEITLPAGDYWIREAESENGAHPAENPVHVKVEEGQTGNAAVLAEFTNNIDTTEIEITKTWADASDQDGLRPTAEEYAALVHLYANGEEVTGAAMAVSQQDDHTYVVTWSELPVEDGGGVIVYTAQEDPIEGYTPDPADGVIAIEGYKGEITNTHEPETVTVRAVKVWANDEDVSFLRRDITFTLSSDQDVTIENAEKTIPANASGDAQTAVWENLPKYHEKELVSYTVAETAVDGYDASLGEMTYNEADDVWEIRITNTLQRSMLKLYKEITFSGNPVTLTDEQKANLLFTVSAQIDGTAYYAVYDTAHTAADGNLHGKWATLTETESSFTYADFANGMLVLENLPVGDYIVTETLAEGGLIENYTWSAAAVRVGRSGEEEMKREDQDALSADAALTAEDFTQVFFRNEFTQDVGELTVEKKVDADDPAFVRGRTFRIALRDADGNYYATNGSVVTEDNKWVTFTAGQEIKWLNLPVNTYFVEEDEDGAAEADYDLTVAYSDAAGVALIPTDPSNTDAPPQTTTVTNAYEQHKGSLKVVKTVKVLGAALDNRSFKLAVRDENGVYYGPDGSVLSEEEKWVPVDWNAETGESPEMIWTNLPVGAYTVEEDEADAQEAGFGLTVTVSDGVTVTKDCEADDAVLTVENLYTYEVGSLAVTKEVVAPDTAENELDGKTFRIAVVDDPQDPAMYFGPDGRVYEKPFWVEIASGETAVWENLASGAYWVIEDTDDAQIAGHSLTAVGDGALAVQVAKDEETDVTVTNTYTDEVGSLRLVKVFDFGESPAPDDIELAGLKFTVSGPFDYSQTVYYAQFTDGEYLITGLPVGNYTVLETNADAMLAALHYTLTSAESDPADGAVTVIKDDTVTVTLTNSYEQDLGSLKVVKTFEGEIPEDADLSALSFTVTGLNFEETFTYGDFEDREDGRYYLIENLPVGLYAVSETGAEGLIAGYTLIVEDSVMAGSAQVEKDETAAVSLTNAYEQDKGSLTVVKGFAGVPADADVSELAFTVTNAAGQYVSASGEIVDEDPGVTYADFTNGVLVIENLPLGEYTVMETNADTLLTEIGYELVSGGSVTEGSAAVEKNRTVYVVLTNEYEQILGKLTIEKTFAGTDGADEAALRSLLFRITDESGEIVEQVLYGQFTEGSYTIENLPLGAYHVEEMNAEGLIAGYTFLAAAGETAADAAITPDGRETEAALKNVYTKDVTQQLQVTKAVKAIDADGEDYGIDEAFTFLLAAVTENAPMPAAGGEACTVTGAGSASFGEITYTAAGEYVYTITEQAGENAGMTYDDAPKYAVVTVTMNEETFALEASVAYGDTEDGALTVTNVYNAAGETVLTGVKRIENRAFRSGDRWTFTLTGSEGAPLPDETEIVLTPTVGESAAVAFGAIHYTLSDAGKTYVYTIAESGEVAGVTNDSEEKTVTVTVTDNGDGTLTVRSTNDEAAFAFVNTYGAEGETVLSAEKALEGRDMTADDAFTFELRRENGELIETVTAAGPGKDNRLEVLFSALHYTLDDLRNEDGTYETTREIRYVIREIRGADGSLTYAENEETVTVTLTDLGNGEIKAEADRTGADVSFVNRYETTSASVEKIWDDNGDQDGTRPETVTVTLLANNLKTETTAVLSEENGWQATADNLPVYSESGDRITYSWIEEIPSGYAISAIGTDVLDGGATVTRITNTTSPDKMCLAVLKVWDDDGDRDGARPDSITVTLTANGQPAKYADGSDVGEIELNEDNNWSALAIGLPIMADGAEIEYAWAEAEVEGYTLTIAADGRITYLKNTHEPEVTQVPVEKIWEDDGDRDGIRPDSITVYLLADGIPAAKAVLSDENGWAYTFTDLPVYENGEKIEYTVDEVKAAGYDTEIGGDAEAGFTITNTHAPETVEVTVIKLWDDAEDQDGARPGTLVVTLSSGDKVTLSQDNDWTATVTGLPKYDGGAEIEYYWTETDVKDYTLTNTETSGYVTTLTNTHEPETTEVTVRKVWEDDDHEDKRPESILMLLKADGETVCAVQLDDSNDWTAAVRDLPVYSGGRVIAYNWEEAAVPAGYVMTLDVDADGVTTVTNTFVTAALVLKKTFEGAPADADLSGLAFTVTGPEFEQTILYGEFTDGRYELDGLVPGRYTVVEENAFGLIENYSLDAAASTISGSAVITGSEPGLIELVNVYTEDVGSLRILKAFCGVPGEDAPWDEEKLNELSFHVQGETGGYDETFVYADFSDEEDLNGNLTLLLVIDQLPIDTYTVTELGAEGILNGYTLQPSSIQAGSAAVIRNGEATVVLKNNYKKDTASLILEKSWSITDADGNEQSPDDFSLGALAFQVTGSELDNGETYDQTFYYAQFTDGKLLIEGLTPGVYTVTETNAEGLIVYYTLTTAVNDGPAAIAKDETGIIRLSNSYTQDKGSIAVTKTVTGAPAGESGKEYAFTVRNAAGKYMTADGEESDVPVEIKVKAGETVTISNLPVGVYTVSEIIGSAQILNCTLTAASVTGGEAQVTVGGTAEVELLNVYEQDEGAVKVTKLAIGAPEGVQFRIGLMNAEGHYMTQSGEESESAVWVTLAGGESAEWTGLPVSTYTVAEDSAEIEGLSLTVTGTGKIEVVRDGETDVTVVNSYTDDLGRLTLVKTFNGLPEDADTAHLAFAITGPGGYSQTVYYIQFTDGKYTIENLPVGEYTVEETNADTLIAAYTLLSSTTSGSTQVVKDGEATVELENNYEQDLGSLTIVKTFRGVPEDADVSGLQFQVTGPDGYSLTVSYADFADGACTIEDLPVGVYSVSEIGAEGLIAHYLLTADSVTSGEADVQKDGEAEIELTNEYEPKLGQLQIRKAFGGQPGDADLSGLTFEVTGPEGFSQTVTYAEFTDGVFTIPDLPEGVYTVAETNAEGLVAHYNLMAISVTDGEAAVTAGETATVKLINLYEPQLGSLKISKTWKGQPDGAALEGLNFRITGPNGFVQNVSYAAFEGGSYTLSQLPVGEYTVTETNAEGLIAHYTLSVADSVTAVSAEVTEGQTASAALRNVYEPDLGSLTIVKTFSGLNESDNVDNLEFRVIGPDGFDETVTYGQFTDGQYTFENLTPGQYVVYETNAAFLSFSLILMNTSVTAANAIVRQGKTTTVELKNDYDNANTDLYIMKVWDDQDNLDGSRPESVIVSLSNGTETVAVLTLDESNDWIGMVTVPLTDSQGNAAVYTWTEETVTGYVLSSQKTTGNLTRITNTHTPELTSVTVVKIWDDNDNAANLRPPVLSVTLSDGKTRTYYVLSEENNWTVTVDGLPKYWAGEEIQYTWSEQSVLGYKQIDVTVDGDVTTFTNYYRRPTPPTPPPDTGEDTPLPIEVTINHVGDCFD